MYKFTKGYGYGYGYGINQNACDKFQVTLWHMIYLIDLFVSVLLYAHVERCSVSPMQDFSLPI